MSRPLSELLAEPQALTAWLAERAGQETLAPALSTALTGLAKAALPPTQALRTLEVLRAAVHRASLDLAAPYLADGAALDARSQQVLPKALQLLNYLSGLYAGLIPKLHQDTQAGDSLALALHRAMADQMALQRLHYRLYLPMADQLWLKLHKRFLMADQLRLADFACADPVLHPETPLSIQHLYGSALMLGCARVNQLSSSAIEATTALLHCWGGHIGFASEAPPADSRHLVVDISADAAPSLQARAALGSTARPCYLRLDKFINRLDMLIDAGDGAVSPGPAGPVPVPLLHHLRSAWSENIQREARESADEAVFAVLGLNACHYQLCGGQDPQAFIGPHKLRLEIAYEAHENIRLIEAQRSGDVWSKFLSNEVKNLARGALPDSFRFQQRFAFEPGQGDGTPAACRTVQLVDRSAHGCGLDWPADSAGLAIGELVAFRDLHTHWTLGQIAWQRRDPQAPIHTGIHLLSRQAIPLVAEKPLGLVSKENWLRIILLPQEAGLRAQAAVLVPPDIFRSGEVITVAQKGVEQQIQLLEPIATLGSCLLFECGFVLHDEAADEA